MKALTLVAVSSSLLFSGQPLPAQEKNPYVRKGSIGVSGKTVSIDRSGMPPSERSRALKAWIGKKVLFMPHPRRDLGDGCPGFTNVPNGGHVSDVCDGKIGTIVSVGPEEYPNVVVDVGGKRFQRNAEAGTDKRPRIEGLLPIEEIDSLRKRLINKPLLAVGGPLYTYDPDTQSYGSVVIAERQRVTVVDVVSSWAANTTSPFRVIVQTAGGAEGFYDLSKGTLGAFFKTSEAAKKERARGPSSDIAPQGELQLLASDGETTEVSTEIVGRIRNNTNRTYGYVQVTFQVYDNLGNQVGSAMANVNGLEPGGIWKFKALCLCRGSNFKLNEITGL